MSKWRIITTILAVSIFIMPLTTYGCSNSPVTNTFEFTDFTRLDIQTAYNVQVIQAATYSISITSSKALVDYLSVTKTEDTLTIKLQPHHQFTDFLLMRKTLKVKIMMPAIHSIDLSGVSVCSVKGFKSTKNLNLNISGASSMTLDNIETGNTNIIVSGASRLEGKVKAENLEFDISGASKVELDGEAEDIKLVSSGASNVNLQEFTSQTATVMLSGASRATVDVRKLLNGSLTGASSLFFLNNPEVEVEVQGASTVKHK